MNVDQMTIGGLIGAALTLIGTIVLGILLHLRESRKVEAAASLTDAQTDQLHWLRFTAEISRLEDRVVRLEEELRTVHREKASVERELAEHRASALLAGQGRQTAQLVVSALHVEQRAKEVKDGG